MSSDPGRILAVDPGDKRIGLAISDPSQTIASPLAVIEHQSRADDARQILVYVKEAGAVLIILGYDDDQEGQPTYQGRKSIRLQNELLRIGDIPVLLWSEFGSTRQAQLARREMNVSRKKRAGHLDDLAATIILQSYLDSLPGGTDHANY